MHVFSTRSGSYSPQVAVAFVFLSGCGDVTEPVETKAAPTPAVAAEVQSDLAASSATIPLSTSVAAAEALWDAAWRVLPTMPAGPLRNKLSIELLEGIARALAGDWRRLATSLDRAGALLDQYARTMSEDQTPQLDVLRLAIGAARTLIHT
jgi:hypothetical protein